MNLNLLILQGVDPTYESCIRKQVKSVRSYSKKVASIKEFKSHIVHRNMRLPSYGFLLLFKDLVSILRIFLKKCIRKKRTEKGELWNYSPSQALQELDPFLNL